MSASLKYAWLTIKHKWFVFLAGLETKAPLWRLLLHDLSKFMPSELPYYGKQFFGDANDPEGFVQCWTKHQNRNAHHWKYWIPRTGHSHCEPPYPDNDPIPMPMWAVCEMVADWLGAGRAYEGKWPDVAEDWPWLKNAWPKLRLHEITIMRLRVVTHKLGFDLDKYRNMD